MHIFNSSSTDGDDGNDIDTTLTHLNALLSTGI